MRGRNKFALVAKLMAGDLLDSFFEQLRCHSMLLVYGAVVRVMIHFFLYSKFILHAVCPILIVQFLFLYYSVRPLRIFCLKKMDVDYTLESLEAPPLSSLILNDTTQADYAILTSFSALVCTTYVFKYSRAWTSEWPLYRHNAVDCSNQRITCTGTFTAIT